MPDVHELVELTLAVGGADADTQVAVEAWPPDQDTDTGVPTTLTAWPADPDVRDRWSANLVPDQAGTWRVRWIVTGSGAGIAWVDVSVAPAPGSAPAGRAYATTGELAAWLEDAVPKKAGRMLRRASRYVDTLIRCAVYDVDEHAMPTDPAVAAALRDATCAQVEWWDETGDEGTGGAVALAGASIGSVRLGGAATSAPGGTVPPGVAPAAWSALVAAGLTSQGPILPGRPPDVVRQGPR